MNDAKTKILWKPGNEVLLALAVALILVMMVIPVPPFLLDILLTLNISISLTILIVAMYTLEPLQFSVFPSLLLIITLFRLALNISCTRLILLNAYAGEVVSAFGQFVVGGNYVVGAVVFAILIIIQFVVITNGAQRIAEVAARFTLDAMPGKQMSIDADLSAGLIDEEGARRRRREIEREADFYGAMDGAAKFVRGDAIASVIIILVNIIGGVIVGTIQKGLPVMDALQRFTLLTVGEGLVTQIPALIISTATGLLVTRAASEGNLGNEISSQLLAQPKALMMIAALLALFGIIPGMPTIPFFIIAAGLALLGRKLQKDSANTIADQKKQEAEKEARKREKKTEEPEDVTHLLKVEPLELLIGFGLISLLDKKQGGDLLDRIVMVRQNFASSFGLVVPPVRIRDNLELRPNAYEIKIYGLKVAKAELMPGKSLVISSAGRELEDELEGIPVKEPAFGLPALWVTQEEKEKAEMLGYTVVDPPSVLITHLSEVIKTFAAELLTRQEVQNMLNRQKEASPVVVEELVPNLIRIGTLQKVLQNLLLERISIRNFNLILETLADQAPHNQEINYLTEKVRIALARNICEEYMLPDRSIPAIILSPQVENLLLQAVKDTKKEAYLALNPELLRALYDRLLKAVEKVSAVGYHPIVLTSAGSRIHLKKLTERVMPQLVVLSFQEIVPEYTIEVVDTIKLEELEKHLKDKSRITKTPDLTTEDNLSPADLMEEDLIKI